MALPDDIMRVLEGVEGWREIQAAPARINALERRVAQLEAALKTRRAPQPADLCPRCNVGTLRIVSEGPAPMHAQRLSGMRRRALACSDATCGHAIDQLIRVGKR